MEKGVELVVKGRVQTLELVQQTLELVRLPHYDGVVNILPRNYKGRYRTSIIIENGDARFTPGGSVLVGMLRCDKEFGFEIQKDTVISILKIRAPESIRIFNRFFCDKCQGFSGVEACINPEIDGYIEGFQCTLCDRSWHITMGKEVEAAR